VPAETIAVDEGDVEDPDTSEISFAIEYDPEAVTDALVYTLSTRVVDAEGTLLYVNDTVTPGVVDGEPLQDVEVETIDFQAQAAEVGAALSESTEALPEESPEA
jgi:uncharacterized lipoprotein YbaY